ncbi:penicillin-binding protein 2 [Candidatus Wolfebacteria bacterium RIFCSPLOWO2_01_FULL_38_11]|uniref:Transpeptidase involved in peptidoglycan synthesis (Penicillin-binding protein 2) n=2 Tax=Candidatus Wolfeibacteriota TaxID=1752735 RepID=A0A0G0ID80_9BACT|nr:MAG: Transpeptidase involved in peptidoglycan synthesis (Penicillin-binding protein 2) [Candidatus Wolfebacteria bacterium GW2011_GWC1_37_10]OGM90456.1 MAG: penicillin-binding protein 2 [Candidatus Wolfebacteria bacterium RIFCSPLOWO2_01_FULL_38_11]
MTKSKDFFLEEAVLDDLAKDLDLLEIPLSEKAFKLVGFFGALIFSIIFLRLAVFGVWQGDFYKHRALVNSGQIVSLSTKRGIIYDRFGNSLVENKPIFRLSLKLTEFFKENNRKQVFEKLAEVLNIPEEEIEETIANVDLEKQSAIILATRLTEEQEAKIKELNLKAVQIEENFRREYSDAKIFSHLLGYTGLVDKEDLKSNEEFSLNDIIGKSGLESYYDNELRGIEGQIMYYRNAKGEIMDEKFLRESAAGYAIETTIDTDFQKYFYSRLLEGLNNVGSENGAGIAINPKNGEILALVSLPGFDNNEISPSALADSRKPLFNRAISGLYSPGSTVKPLVALAALKENIIDVDTEIFSRGYIEVPNPYYPDKPSRFVDWKAHGWVDFYSAIARSSNIYFYAVGGGLPENEYGLISGNSGKIKGLGVEKLNNYWRQFGFEEKTGIDLSSEASGYLPDPKKKEKVSGQIWRLGDTYNVSIGQGDLIITPIELINYIAAIANGGKIYRPFIAKKMISGNGETIKEIQPQILNDYSNLEPYLKEVRKAMTDTVSKPYGTAYSLNDLGIKIAAKTGTAQIQENAKINAFFVGYEPADDPEIAVLVLVENAKEGGLNAVPIAKDVLKWYYENRIKP